MRMLLTGYSLLQSREPKQRCGQTKTPLNERRFCLNLLVRPSGKHSTTTNAIEALCRYFDCKVEDVMVYQPDDK